MPLSDTKTSCVIEAATLQSGTSPKPVDPRARDNDNEALAALVGFDVPGATYSDWLQESGMKESTFKDVRKRLVASGRVVKIGNHYLLGTEGPEVETGTKQGQKLAA